MKQRLEAVEALVPPAPAGETWRRSGSWSQESQESQERTCTQASLRHPVLTEHLLGPGPVQGTGDLALRQRTKTVAQGLMEPLKVNIFFGGEV